MLISGLNHDGLNFRLYCFSLAGLQAIGGYTY